ncbi:9038_t:CDS:2 [Funneliformis geosporum]|nr:9038_t:CDS:2 [Funneliformis geosporum]
MVMPVHEAVIALLQGKTESVIIMIQRSSDNTFTLKIAVCQLNYHRRILCEVASEFQKISLWNTKCENG